MQSLNRRDAVVKGWVGREETATAAGGGNAANPGERVHQVFLWISGPAQDIDRMAVSGILFIPAVSSHPQFADDGD